eukprot:jgi/Bigna1/77752/fgenesh1_pg.50_\
MAKRTSKTRAEELITDIKFFKVRSSSVVPPSPATSPDGKSSSSSLLVNLLAVSTSLGNLHVFHLLFCDDAKNTEDAQQQEGGGGGGGDNPPVSGNWKVLRLCSYQHSRTAPITGMAFKATVCIGSGARNEDRKATTGGGGDGSSDDSGSDDDQAILLAAACGPDILVLRLQLLQSSPPSSTLSMSMTTECYHRAHEERITGVNWLLGGGISSSSTTTTSYNDNSRLHCPSHLLLLTCGNDGRILKWCYRRRTSDNMDGSCQQGTSSSSSSSSLSSSSIARGGGRRDGDEGNHVFEITPFNTSNSPAPSRSDISSSPPPPSSSSSSSCSHKADQIAKMYLDQYVDSRGFNAVNITNARRMEGRMAPLLVPYSGIGVSRDGLLAAVVHQSPVQFEVKGTTERPNRRLELLIYPLLLGGLDDSRIVRTIGASSFSSPNNSTEQKLKASIGFTTNLGICLETQRFRDRRRGWKGKEDGAGSEQQLAPNSQAKIPRSSSSSSSSSSFLLSPSPSARNRKDTKLLVDLALRCCNSAFAWAEGALREAKLVISNTDDSCCQNLLDSMLKEHLLVQDNKTVTALLDAFSTSRRENGLAACVFLRTALKGSSAAASQPPPPPPPPPLPKLKETKSSLLEGGQQIEEWGANDDENSKTKHPSAHTARLDCKSSPLSPIREKAAATLHFLYSQFASEHGLRVLVNVIDMFENKSEVETDRCRSRLIAEEIGSSVALIAAFACTEYLRRFAPFPLEIGESTSVQQQQQQQLHNNDDSQLCYPCLSSVDRAAREENKAEEEEQQQQQQQQPRRKARVLSRVLRLALLLLSRRTCAALGMHKWTSIIDRILAATKKASSPADQQRVAAKELHRALLDVLPREECPICAAAVVFSNPFEEFCAKGHRLQRCRVSWKLGPVLRRLHCESCRGTILPSCVQSKAWEALQHDIPKRRFLDYNQHQQPSLAEVCPLCRCMAHPLM